MKFSDWIKMHEAVLTVSSPPKAPIKNDDDGDNDCNPKPDWESIVYKWAAKNASQFITLTDLENLLDSIEPEIDYNGFYINYLKILQTITSGVRFIWRIPESMWKAHVGFRLKQKLLRSDLWKHLGMDSGEMWACLSTDQFYELVFQALIMSSLSDMNKMNNFMAYMAHRIMSSKSHQLEKNIKEKFSAYIKSRYNPKLDEKTCKITWLNEKQRRGSMSFQIASCVIPFNFSFSNVYEIDNMSKNEVLHILSSLLDYLQVVWEGTDQQVGIQDRMEFVIKRYPGSRGDYYNPPEPDDYEVIFEEKDFTFKVEDDAIPELATQIPSDMISLVNDTFQFSQNDYRLTSYIRLKSVEKKGNHLYLSVRLEDIEID